MPTQPSVRQALTTVYSELATLANMVDPGVETQSLVLPVAQMNIDLTEPMQVCDDQNAAQPLPFLDPFNYLVNTISLESADPSPTPSIPSISGVLPIYDISLTNSQVDIIPSGSASDNANPPSSKLTKLKVMLHQGIVLSFYPDDIPAIPALRFADVNALARWWDDSSPEWNPERYPYNIKGQVVAMKYWNQVYKGD